MLKRASETGVYYCTTVLHTVHRKEKSTDGPYGLNPPHWRWADPSPVESRIQVGRMKATASPVGEVLAGLFFFSSPSFPPPERERTRAHASISLSLSLSLPFPPFLFPPFFHSLRLLFSLPLSLSGGFVVGLFSHHSHTPAALRTTVTQGQHAQAHIRTVLLVHRTRGRMSDQYPRCCQTAAKGSSGLLLGCVVIIL